MASITRFFTALLLLPAVLGSALPTAHGESLEERGDPCRKVRDVVEALKRQRDPWKFCDGHKPKPQPTTVYVTTTPTVTEYKWKTVTQTPPTCANVRRDEGGAFSDIEERDPGYYDPLPYDLRRYGHSKVNEACRCLPRPPRPTITKTVTAPSITVTDYKYKTVCKDCIPVGSPCRIEQPGDCCSQTCACISGVCNCFQL